MTTRHHDDLLIRIDSIDQLFNAPPANPFSDKPAVVLGQAALPYAVRQAVGQGLRDWRGKRLVIQLPADQIHANLEAKVGEAVRRFAAAKRADNRTTIRLSRWRSLVGLGIALAIAVLLLVAGMVVTRLLIPSASDTAKSLILGVVTIFIWATVWHPWEGLVYDWVGPALEDRLLHAIATMEIVIEAET
jgi:hypothetical protein